jgi:type I site-specific restriction-modification system R (restriction) subunit
MNFLKEITESRIIRQLNQARQFDLEEITERVFEHLLALQVLAQVRPKEARQYAQTIANNISFDGFRPAQRDLYNLIALVVHADRYSDTVDKNINITLPEFAIRRNIKSIADGRIDVNDYNNMMMTLQRRYHRIGPRQANLRREISDWSQLSRRNKLLIIDQLVMLMRERNMNSDLYYHITQLPNFIS